MTEGFNAADNSSIAPMILPIALDNCQNSAVGAAVGAKLAIDCEGFFRLTVEDFAENAIAIIKRVMQKGDRIILQQAGKDLAAIVPETEFHKIDYLMQELKPSQFFPDEEAYYEDDGAIHCIYPDELVENLDNILADVKEFDELFGLLPTEEMGENIDIFISVAILMSIDRFWVPDYLIAEQARLKMLS
ncbi:MULTISPECIES: type II toxin-antitoxin system Phd/YefM family antitoxin [unclassified Microcoleus]|uniref:type II toxin-antitoxin system Phd/YefM family antitoxin n=1 Tax=unclassified Microcoleus TaxID=2642155 RepID=UPI002FD79E7E